MSRIVLGKSGGRNVEINLDTLLYTRLLIQANSGGGKSFLIRRLAEQIFGKVPVWICDPEGEFATLREKYGFVLVGKGGDTPADPRSAALVAHKLLELRASAIFDLYELKPPDRHRWMRLFIEAMMTAPKHLWGALVFFLDECQLFCPEGGKGGMAESEAAGAVQDLIERGRKRGFCPIPATQRLARLSKHVTGQMLNRLIGMTFEDVDVDRAIDLLSVTKEEKLEFKKGLRTLEPGNFWGFGRAISTERILIKVGSVQTTHPEPGSSKHAAAPPPAPSKVKALLPKLADLPKEAEEKAKTEAQLKADLRAAMEENRRLKLTVAAIPLGTIVDAAKRKNAPPSKPVKVEVPAIKPSDLLRIERMMAKADSAAGRMQECIGSLRGFSDAIRDNVAKIEKAQRGAIVAPPPKKSITPPVPFRDKPAGLKTVSVSSSPRERGEAGDPDPDSVSKPERRILSVLAQYEEGCEIGKIALLSGYRISGTFKNYLSSLRAQGYMTGQNAQAMRITHDGKRALGQWDPLPQGQDLVDYWVKHPSFGNGEQKILQALLSNPDGLTINQIAEATSYEISGTFKNYLSALRTAGVLVGRNNETMRLCVELLAAVEV